MNSKGATLINGTFIGITGYDNNGANVTYSFAKNSVITDIFVQIDVAPGTGNGWGFYVQKNGIDTAFYASLTDSTTQVNTAGNALFNAGDNYTIRIAKAGSPPNVTHCFVTLMYK
jgi:hypothetical protein